MTLYPSLLWAPGAKGPNGDDHKSLQCIADLLKPVVLYHLVLMSLTCTCCLID